MNIALGDQPIRLFFNPRYNLKNATGTRRWNLIGGRPDRALGSGPIHRPDPADQGPM